MGERAGLFLVSGQIGDRLKPYPRRGAARVGPGTGSARDVGAVEFGALLPWLYVPLVAR